MLSIAPNDRITYRLAHADEDLVVVEKPPRTPTQPGKGHLEDTLLNGLFAAYGQKLQNLGASRGFGLLHRLDRMASGLLIVALSVRAWEGVRAAFERREVKKFYWAIVKGIPSNPSGVINRPIAEATAEKRTARIAHGGKPAVTAYRVLASTDAAALLECRAVTGRLHQVRVHLASIHCPILGDDLYAKPAAAAAAPRLALHAHRLVFDHPITGARLDIRTKFPKDLAPVLRRLGLERPTAAEPEAPAPGSDPPSPDRPG